MMAKPSTCRFRAGLFPLIGLLLLLTACAPRNAFVLMPDAEGHVGAITVENEKGRQTLDREGQGVVVGGKESAPSAPRRVSEAEIQNWFGEAMAVEPTPPEVFTLLFRTGTAKLAPESASRIPDILAAIQERESRDISVVGHSDRKGSDELNWRLSLERAEGVRQRLMELGVPAEIISTTSHGEGNPVIPTEDNVSEPRNRRVEVTVR